MRVISAAWRERESVEGPREPWRLDEPIEKLIWFRDEYSDAEDHGSNEEDEEDEEDTDMGESHLVARW